MNGARSAHLESAHVLVRPPRGRRVLWSGLWECERYLAVAAGTTRICTCPSSTVSRAYTVWVLRQLFTKCINSWRPAARPSDRFMASDSYSVPGTVRGDTAAHCSTNSRLFFGESKLIYYNVRCIVIKVVGLLLQTVCLNTVFSRGGMLTALMGCKKNHDTSTT